MNIVQIVRRILYKIYRNGLSIRDRKVDKKVLVFESDDWGSIRMSTKESWDELRKQGYPVDKRPYERYDTLETSEDLIALFEVFERYKDRNGNPPCLTANMLMCNPDFEKIKEHGFSEYFYEPFYMTYLHNDKCGDVLSLMKYGVERRLFIPQYHGREHFNVEEWMAALRQKEPNAMTAFMHNMCGIAPRNNPHLGNKYMVALRSSSEEANKKILLILSEGLKMFEDLWGTKSISFVAPCYTWNDSIEELLASKGVKLIQTSRQSRSSSNGTPIFHYMGQKNNSGQIYSVRNCFFEPSTSKRKNEVDECFNEIKRAFKKGLPAIVSSHRINYVGSLNKERRDENLRMLDNLLRKVLKEFPDVEFYSSDQMVDFYK